MAKHIVQDIVQSQHATKESNNEMVAMATNALNSLGETCFIRNICGL